MSRGGKKKLDIKKRSLRKLTDDAMDSARGGYLVGSPPPLAPPPLINPPPVYGGTPLGGADPYGQTVGYKVPPVGTSKMTI